MKTAVAVTEEIDDLELAVEELSRGIREQVTPGSGSFAVCCCGPETDTAELGERLRGEFGCDVIGITTPAMMELRAGYTDIGIQMALMTGDDVAFAGANAGPLGAGSYEAMIREAYAEAASRLGARPKLILVAAPFVPEITSDRYLAVLDEVSGHAPIFGGVASDYFDMEQMRTFLNDDASHTSLRFVLMAGNINPVFSVAPCTTGTPLWRGPVTKSEGSRVYLLGNRTPVQLLSELAHVSEDRSRKMLFDYMTMPFMMEGEPGEQPIARAVINVDAATGAADFTSRMPEGTMLSLHSLPQGALERSCRDTLEGLIQRIRGGSGQAPSFAIACSCCGRHLINTGSRDIESGIMRETIEPIGGMSCAGYYAFGEFCPTEVFSDGTARNKFHNLSFATVAF